VASVLDFAAETGSLGSLLGVSEEEAATVAAMLARRPETVVGELMPPPPEVSE
jgi:hypothetical protein